MKLIIIVAVCFVAAVVTYCHLKYRDISPVSVGVHFGLEEWAHGWKAKYVHATRYSNPHIGFNIGFTFPGKEYWCDSSRVVAFMAHRGGMVYQCGGYPGAEMMVVFNDVKDVESANIKLKTMLPELSAFMASLKHQ